MRFIFRNPFISSKKRAIGETALICAEAYGTLAQSELKSNNYTVTDSVINYKKKQGEYLENAARNLGFRSVTDMEEYNKQCHVCKVFSKA